MGKKSFTAELDPAELFMSKTTPHTATIQEAPEGYHINPLLIENKSKRLQLLIKPSTAEKLKDKAQREGRSVNYVINVILEKALMEE